MVPGCKVRSGTTVFTNLNMLCGHFLQHTSVFNAGVNLFLIILKLLALDMDKLMR